MKNHVKCTGADESVRLRSQLGESPNSDRYITLPSDIEPQSFMAGPTIEIRPENRSIATMALFALASPCYPIPLGRTLLRRS